VRAAYIEDFGAPSAIRYGDLPDPVPGPGQVLVRVEAVAVNSVDTFLRSGRWRSEVRFPLAVGRDLVGIVERLAPGVGDLRPGERVWTNSAGYGGRPGATAELVPVPRDRIYRLPSGADPLPFVASLHPGATAHGALLGRARLRPGETVVVVGANGAVGMCLVQAAAGAGAEVVAVVRRPAATDRLRALGAARVVVAEAAQAPAAAGPADVFVDTTRRVDVAAVPDHLNPRGRMLLIAGQGRAALDLWPLYVREIQILGFVMSGMTVPELQAAADWINAARPVVDVGQVLGFDQAARAHELVESGGLPRTPDGTVGRVVLRP
jgi:NADPH:quinone reductase-like Zn-dependent oxidoreductase